MKMEQVKVGATFYEVQTPETIEEWCSSYGVDILLHFAERGFKELARSNAKNLLKKGLSTGEVEERIRYFVPRYIVRKLGSFDLEGE